MSRPSGAVDYSTLAELRYRIRRFLRTREVAARDVGVEPQQYLVLLQIKGLEGRVEATIGALAERLQIRHHAAVQLVDRLESGDLVRRRRIGRDGRRVVVKLRPRGERVLQRLAVFSLAELSKEGPALVESLRRLVTKSTRRSVMRNATTRLVLPILGAALAAIPAAVGAQGHHGVPAARTTVVQTPYPIRVTEGELHAQGGVPRRWKFLLPPGDVDAGRRVFVDLECHACHEVKGEEFPGVTRTPPGAAPALTGMGAQHPPEYFAESIVNPNRVIVLGPGYTGADSFSRMPSYVEAMTLKQLIDVVAYLTSLTKED